MGDIAGIRGLEEGLPETRAAIAFAQRRHAGQRRKVDGAPFICHPLEVAALLRDAGAPDDVIAAGVLHDVVEKADVSERELRELFGPRIAAVVLAVSEDPSISGYSSRKAALREQAVAAGTDALMVFAADKVSKARELTGAGAVSPIARARRLAYYRDSLRVLEDHLPDSGLVALLRVELERLPEQVADLAGAR